MKSEEVVFSVIVPTFNRAELLKRCLESLVAQTFASFEVIVCDDGSKDNTAEVVDSYKNKLNLKYLVESNWGGPARPRNNGLKEANGEWVAFLDSDDYWAPEKLEMVFHKILKSDLIYHKMQVLDIRGKRYSTIGSKLRSGFIFPKLLIEGNRIPLSSSVCRRDLILEVGGFDENKKLIAVEDYDLWIRLSKKKCRVSFIPALLGFYHLGEDNISVGMKQIRKLRSVYLKHIEAVERSEKKAVLQAYLYQKIKITLSERILMISCKEIRLLNLIQKLKIYYLLARMKN